MSLIWGIPYLLIRIAVRSIDPGTLLVFRTIPAALVLLPIAYVNKGFASLRGRWHWVVLFAVAEFGIPWFFMGTAEKHLTSSLTSLLASAVPLVTLGINAVTGREHGLSPIRLLGVGLGTAGVAGLVGFNVGNGSWKYIAMMMVVVLGYSVGPMILRYRLEGGNGTAVVGHLHAGDGNHLVTLGRDPLAPARHGRTVVVGGGTLRGLHRGGVCRLFCPRPRSGPQPFSGGDVY